jgi:hypothetical protein
MTIIRSDYYFLIKIFYLIKTVFNSKMISNVVHIKCCKI